MQTLARHYNTAIITIMHISKHAVQGNGGDSTGYAIGSYELRDGFRWVGVDENISQRNHYSTNPTEVCKITGTSPNTTATAKKGVGIKELPVRAAMILDATRSEFKNCSDHNRAKGENGVNTRI
ncbi:MAG: hypothetical protein LBK23_06065 [Oscillospiraceae bacterium]|nr:hypothetical protein [Oscillospiraceae bacterium]